MDDEDLPNQLSSFEKSDDARYKHNLWRLNYHEASIYIEEGLNNDKFENHPRRRVTNIAQANSLDSPQDDRLVGSHSSSSSGPDEASGLGSNPNYGSQTITTTTPQAARIAQSRANGHDATPNKQRHHGLRAARLMGAQFTTIETYILVHNKYFYILDFVSSLVLLLMALVEPPAVSGLEMDPKIHAAVEIVLLSVIALELILKFRWTGPKQFFKHKRTVMKSLCLLTMIIEAIVILLRKQGHSRYSRALRPIFLVDNHYCIGIRRCIRQTLQSTAPIVDMLTLALFFMFVFSIFGFYLFAPHNPSFSDMASTVGNLIVLATTSNMPDLYMPSLEQSRWTIIFFVLFVIIHLFVLTNLTMAAVYESFTRKEKEKFHKLLLHRRKACQQAFKLLVSRKEPDRIHYRQFMGLMRYLNSKCSLFDAYLIFKALDVDQVGSIALQDFYQIYDFIKLDWKLIYPQVSWYDSYPRLPRLFKRLITLVQRIHSAKIFEWLVNVTIACMAILQFTEATTFEVNSNRNAKLMFRLPQTLNASKTEGAPQDLDNSDELQPDSTSTLVFMVLFVVETSIRLFALGASDYWRNNWNKFDLLVLGVSVWGLVATGSAWVLVLRVLRLIRLFEFKRRYKDMWQTLVYILMKRFVSMVCVVLIVYYFFAIIGMELMSSYDLRDCCAGTSIENQFKFENRTISSPRYYLNNFENIFASYITLFSMSSNTYWLVAMNGYVYVSKQPWLRLYFGVYYICSIVVMNIVIAFILESFLFRINYRGKMGNDKCDDADLFTVTVTLSSSEVEFLYNNVKMTTQQNSTDRNSANLSLLLDKFLADIKTTSDQDCERQSLLGFHKQQQPKRNSAGKLSPRHHLYQAHTETTSLIDHSNEGIESGTTSTKAGSLSQREFYFVYQAEQIRNKFSFTMKMYAQEVECWLAEAQEAEQDQLSAMICRNQVNAEHVAMAKLARRNLAGSGAHNELVSQWTRARSASYGAGGAANWLPSSRRRVNEAMAAAKRNNTHRGGVANKGAQPRG